MCKTPEPFDLIIGPRRQCGAPIPQKETMT